ncbi:hypothetical protein IFM89_031200 [Coptis chinensis]|uniref:Uncharacterized protein n=1 Tax=Coptis chinensis TaxID=261450 RepID=A0A835IU96_9MAGN|nr:hypothetical protein IFM89_031200 [Coptis chinensis]
MTVTEPRRSSRIAELPTPVYEEKTRAKLPTGVYEEKPTPVAIIGERRSSRISKLPTPVYKEDPTVIEESPTRVNHVIETTEDSRVNPVMERAEDLKSKFENGFPSFVKPMTQSYLKGGTWLACALYNNWWPMLTGTNIYMLSLGDFWSSSTIDLYLHRRTTILGNPFSHRENSILPVSGQSSKLVSAALRDVNTKEQDAVFPPRHNTKEALTEVDKLEVTLELLADKEDFGTPMPSTVNLSIFGSDPPLPTDSNGGVLLLDSSWNATENCFRVASNACFDGQSLDWASSAG